MGIYNLHPEGDDVWLDSLFIDPDAIGRGYGKQLWHHAVSTARLAGYRRMLVEADPYAEEFYQKMGMRRFSERESAVQAGRLLPLLDYALV
jgi:GNAT superfamily N-acetyltransferase